MKHRILTFSFVMLVNALAYCQCVCQPACTISAVSAAGVTGSSPTSISLAWPGVSTYEYSVKYKESSSGIYVNSTEFSSANQVTVTGLLPGRFYDFQVLAKRTCDCLNNGKDCTVEKTASSGETKNVPTAPATPSNLAAATTTITTTSIPLTWTGVDNAVNYTVQYTVTDFTNPVNAPAVTGTSTILTSLTPGTPYKIRVLASNTGGSSDPSASIIASTLFGPTTTIAAGTITNASFIAKWDPPSNAIASTRYKLDVASDQNFNTILKTYPDLTTTSQSVSSATGISVTPGTFYYYRVRVFNETGGSAVSNTTSLVTIPATPTGLKATAGVTTTSIPLTWDLMSNANKYAIQYSTNDFTTYVNAPDVSTNSTTLIGLTNGTPYKIHIRSSNASGSLPFSSAITVSTLFNPTTASAATAITNDSFVANWVAPSNAIATTRYQLDVASDQNFNMILKTYSDLSASSQSVSSTTGVNIKAGTFYYYRVKVVNETGSSMVSNTTSLVTIPATPAGLAAAAGITTSSIPLTWDPVTNATTYTIQYSADDFATSATVNVTGTTTVLNSLSNGTPYKIRIRSSNINGSLPYSAAITVPTLFEPTTTLPASVITTTSFTANWAAPPNASSGTQYQLIIASDKNVNNVLKTFTGLSATSFSVSEESGLALNPGTVYYYGINVINESGISALSTITSLITLPLQPEVLPPSEVTINSFQANWKVSTGASAYRLDVSSDSEFNTFLDGFNDLLIDPAALTQMISGLAPNSKYFYRVRAVNESGISVSSSQQIAITVSLPPVFTKTSEVANDQFRINWQMADNVISYLVEVAADKNFSSPLPAYTNVAVTTNSLLISGLTPGTIYYYRMRMVNTGGTSENNAIASQLLLPASPQEFKISDITSTSMKAQWLQVKSATEYQIEVSRTLAFDDIVKTYDPKVIPSSITEIVLNENLSPATIYYLRVRAKNEIGLSAYSETRTVSTLTLSGTDAFEIKITNLQSPAAGFSNAMDKITFNVTGGIGVMETKLFHRKKSEKTYQAETLSSTDSNFTVFIQEDWLDDFGMEFYIEATDQGNHLHRETTHTFLIKVPDVNVPLRSAGKALSNYQIISIPYSLSTTRIADLFEPISGLGSYNKTLWRLVRYKDGDNQDYEDGLSVSNIERGQGYWFISKNPVTLSFGAGTSFDNSIDQPFKLNLKKGWNQIGNPFPYSLSWNEIRTLPENAAASLGSLLTFDPSTIALKESDVLNLFDGGFVFADEATTITFPVSLSKKQSGGRTKTTTGNFFSSVQDDSNWYVSISLKQGNALNELSGVGMNQLASDAKDKFDLHKPPSVTGYADLSTSLPNDEYPVSRSIVSPSSDYAWTMSLSGIQTETVTMQWNTGIVSQLKGDLILHDIAKNQIVNMSKVSGYEATPSATLIIRYNQDKLLSGDQVSLFVPYPNPFLSHISIPYHYSSSSGDQVNAQLIIADLNGKIIAQRIAHTNPEEKIAAIEWDGTTDNGATSAPGFYIYRLIIQQNNKTSLHQGKIIKK